MTGMRGQALVEYACILVLLVAALCLPYFGGPAVVAQLESALRLYWQSWSAALLTLAVAS
ncbi:MAG: hypothetical protein AB7P31_06685 [Steroidobacteraceae bacterium]